MMDENKTQGVAHPTAVTASHSAAVPGRKVLENTQVCQKAPYIPSPGFPITGSNSPADNSFLLRHLLSVIFTLTGQERDMRRDQEPLNLRLWGFLPPHPLRAVRSEFPLGPHLTAKDTLGVQTPLV